MWHLLFTNAGPGDSYDFDMIGRLAELPASRRNPLFSRPSARRTRTCSSTSSRTPRGFSSPYRADVPGSPAVLTAVGDVETAASWRWAGAVENMFDAYQERLRRRRHDLVMNYRSAPRLVQSQQTLIAAIEPGTPAAVATDDGATGEGECRVLLYADDTGGSAPGRLGARVGFGESVDLEDICVLTRNKPADTSISSSRACGGGASRRGSRRNSRISSSTRCAAG